MTDYAGFTDAELIAAARRDPDAFRVLYDRYARRLHRFFVARGAGADGAVDLVAESFAQAWASRARFRDLTGGSAAPWLFVIARRVLIASVQRGRIERELIERLEVIWPESDSVPATEWLDGIDAAMEEALGSLPVNHRRALELRVVQGLGYAAIAAELRCTQTAARIRVSRGLARLKTQLEGGN